VQLSIATPGWNWLICCHGTVTVEPTIFRLRMGCTGDKVVELIRAGDAWRQYFITFALSVRCCGWYQERIRRRRGGTGDIGWVPEVIR